MTSCCAIYVPFDVGGCLFVCFDCCFWFCVGLGLLFRRFGWWFKRVFLMVVVCLMVWICFVGLMLVIACWLVWFYCGVGCCQVCVFYLRVLWFGFWFPGCLGCLSLLFESFDIVTFLFLLLWCFMVGIGVFRGGFGCFRGVDLGVFSVSRSDLRG